MVTDAIRLITRYSNRKLYDTFSHGYVTLEELAQIIRDGYNIKVVNKKDNTDITNATIINVAAKTVGSEDFVKIALHHILQKQEEISSNEEVITSTLSTQINTAQEVKNV